MQSINLQYTPIGVEPIIHVSQYDIGRQFQLNIYDGSQAYLMPSGTMARIDGLKPDGTGFSYSDAVSVNDNVVTVTTNAQMTMIEGTVICEIRFINGGHTIGTLNFKIEVEKSPINDDTDISETEIPAIIELGRNNMLEAEAWARGTKDGVEVDSDDAQYQNNSKYYSEQSALSATESENSATASKSSATISANNATASAGSAVLSESWAIGGTNTREGEDTNNAFYWSRQAQSATQDVSAYIAILKLILGTVYLSTEDGNNLITEDGDKILIDY